MRGMTNFSTFLRRSRKRSKEMRTERITSRHCVSRYKRIGDHPHGSVESPCDHCDARPRYIDAPFGHFRLKLSSISCCLHNVASAFFRSLSTFRTIGIFFVGNFRSNGTDPRPHWRWNREFSRSTEINCKSRHSSVRVYLRGDFRRLYLKSSTLNDRTSFSTCLTFTIELFWTFPHSLIKAHIRFDRPSVSYINNNNQNEDTVRARWSFYYSSISWSRKSHRKCDLD